MVYTALMPIPQDGIVSLTGPLHVGHLCSNNEILPTVDFEILGGRGV